jgi:beta-galactosidase/beta-glucuronidase
MKTKSAARTPRPEYPRPQFVRRDWINLNGTWSYTFDFSGSGHERDFQNSKGFDGRIIVPFCPESRLSGVGFTDFINCLWYHREIRIPGKWEGKKILLHFGAVDFICEAFVDGRHAGVHHGGSASFSLDITRLVKPGASHRLVIRVLDDTRSGVQPGGKQSDRRASYECSYTRTTGIWQTVWLEAVSPIGLERVHIIPDLDGGRFVVIPRYHGAAAGSRLRASLIDGSKIVAKVVVPASQNVPCELAIRGKARSWSPSSPFLYDLQFDVLDARGNVVDSARSYAGLRKVHIEGSRVFLNNSPLYQRLVLDQGFYPDGIWTAPTDAALKRDIKLAMRAGFNGARLHQKVFEERFHYWADRLGYLTWSESASWGIVVTSGHQTPENKLHPLEAGALNFLNEWREILTRDRNHPSIIAWSPFNETWTGPDKALRKRLQNMAFDLTRDLDPTRPVNDASGYRHIRTDLWTVHNYEQDPAKLQAVLTPGKEGVWRNFPKDEPEYSGQPYIIDEFGGIKWTPGNKRAGNANAWGYGQEPKTIEEFYARLDGQVDAILSLGHICGYCYTQLTDVEQEQNGVYLYNRSPKFDMKRIARIFSRAPGRG